MVDMPSKSVKRRRERELLNARAEALLPEVEVSPLPDPPCTLDMVDLVGEAHYAEWAWEYSRSDGRWAEEINALDDLYWEERSRYSPSRGGGHGWNVDELEEPYADDGPSSEPEYDEDFHVWEAMRLERELVQEALEMRDFARMLDGRRRESMVIDGRRRENVLLESESTASILGSKR